jgi:hypothetical protein
MSSIADIERAIEKLSPPQMEELARWIEGLRVKRAKTLPVEKWLERARGAARSGESTARIMALTRGEE